jgi:hypothetical protein
MNDVQLDPAGRQRRRKLIKAIRLPHVSGKASAAWLVACFALTGVLIPMAVRLPLWVDFEIVLTVWWVIWVGVLARLLYVGQPVSDDHSLGQPRPWYRAVFEPAGVSPDTEWAWLVLGGSEGCALYLFLVFAFFLLVLAAWVVVEVAVPVVAFLLYFMVRAMLATALNRDHGCQGRVVRSAARAVLWATVYTAPLAGVVWLVHRVHGPHA